VCKEFPRSCNDLSTCSCSRFGACVPHLRAAFWTTLFLGPLTSSSRREEHPPPTRLGSQTKFAGSPISRVLMAGRCWWHCASQVLRPCRAVANPTLLLRLDRVDLGSLGRGGDLQKSKRCCDAAVGGPWQLWEHRPKPAWQAPDRANSLRSFHLLFIKKNKRRTWRASGRSASPKPLSVIFEGERTCITESICVQDVLFRIAPSAPIAPICAIPRKCWLGCILHLQAGQPQGFGGRWGRCDSDK